MKNYLDFFKTGSKIHIKKSTRGSFTSYCGGKVTEECIRKGKSSPDPKIRKKATFADNARHWKHKNGGTLKAALGANLLFSRSKQDGYNEDDYRTKVDNDYLISKLGLPKYTSETESSVSTAPTLSTTDNNDEIWSKMVGWENESQLQAPSYTSYYTSTYPTSAGKTIYKNGVVVDGLSLDLVGLISLLNKKGVNVRITSTTDGTHSEHSHHPEGNAVDITPHNVSDRFEWDNMWNIIHKDPEIRQYMIAHKLGTVDERTRGGKEWTGAHIHIGTDSKAAAKYRST